MDEELDAALRTMLAPTNDRSQPNFSSLALLLKNLDLISLNIKFFGFELARQLAQALPIRENLSYSRVGLTCKPSTQADLESDWAAYWCKELRIPLVFHRKLWELAYFLQALAEADLMSPGRSGLGFGCGEEPLASYLASRGVSTVVTDLESDQASSHGWRQSGQHLSGVDGAFKPYLTDRATFDAHVRHRYVDMNAIPADLTSFDFSWSICALEHLGSIQNAMDFVVNAMRTLKPGGLAIHTTEFNFLSDGPTVDNWPTVLLQRGHFETLATRLRSEGHEIAPLDFDVGTKPLDRFIDIPPYPGDPGAKLERMNGERGSTHLKLSVDGFASTCFGLIVRARPPESGVRRVGDLGGSS